MNILRRISQIRHKGIDSNDLDYSKLNRSKLNYINKYTLERYGILRRDFSFVDEDGVIKYKVKIKSLSAKYYNQEEEAELTLKNIKYSLKNIRWDILLNSPTTPEIKIEVTRINFKSPLTYIIKVTNNQDEISEYIWKSANKLPNQFYLYNTEDRDDVLLKFNVKYLQKNILYQLKKMDESLIKIMVLVLSFFLVYEDE